MRSRPLAPLAEPYSGPPINPAEGEHHRAILAHYESTVTTSRKGRQQVKVTRRHVRYMTGWLHDTLVSLPGPDLARLAERLYGVDPLLGTDAMAWSEVITGGVQAQCPTVAHHASMSDALRAGFALASARQEASAMLDYRIPGKPSLARHPSRLRISRVWPRADEPSAVTRRTGDEVWPAITLVRSYLGEETVAYGPFVRARTPRRADMRAQRATQRAADERKRAPHTPVPDEIVETFLALVSGQSADIPTDRGTLTLRRTDSARTTCTVRQGGTIVATWQARTAQAVAHRLATLPTA